MWIIVQVGLPNCTVFHIWKSAMLCKTKYCRSFKSATLELDKVLPAKEKSRVIELYMLLLYTKGCSPINKHTTLLQWKFHHSLWFLSYCAIFVIETLLNNQIFQKQSTVQSACGSVVVNYYKRHDLQLFCSDWQASAMQK